IKKQHLDEIRTLGKPPAIIQSTMEAVCMLLSGKKMDWTAIRKMMVDASFIPSIVKFDSKSITAKTRKEIETTYLTDPKFNFENVNRASKACGPLVKWVSAQMQYSSILDRVKPLRDEVEELEKAAAELHKKQQ